MTEMMAGIVGTATVNEKLFRKLFLIAFDTALLLCLRFDDVLNFRDYYTP